ncbi:hypothetical protein L9F63_015024, partial [Diploptera punctata]
ELNGDSTNSSPKKYLFINSKTLFKIIHIPNDKNVYNVDTCKFYEYNAGVQNCSVIPRESVKCCFSSGVGENISGKMFRGKCCGTFSPLLPLEDPDILQNFSSGVGENIVGRFSRGSRGNVEGRSRYSSDFSSGVGENVIIPSGVGENVIFPSGVGENVFPSGVGEMLFFPRESGKMLFFPRESGKCFFLGRSRYSS